VSPKARATRSIRASLFQQIATRPGVLEDLSAWAGLGEASCGCPRFDGVLQLVDLFHSYDKRLRVGGKRG
jgi:hypothetical protein